VHEFKIHITKDASGLGIDVLIYEQGVLLVSAIKQGPILMWNQKHHEKMRSLVVAAGDRIVAVNDVTGGCEELIEALKVNQTLDIHIRRCLEYDIVVTRAGRLGIDITQKKDSLGILRVADGPVRDWNKSAPMDLEVRAGDSIIEVNSVRGTSEQLLEAIKVSDQLRMRIRRHTANLYDRESLEVEEKRSRPEPQTPEPPPAGHYSVTIKDFPLESE